MTYQVADIERDVRVALDQNMVSDALAGIGDVDTLALDEIIESKIVEAVQRVHMDAPYYLLHSGHNLVDNLGDAIYWEDLESGYVLLPSDFMRLVVFEMSDWERPVYTAISTDDPQYAQQRSRYKGIRGCPQKPVCAIVMRPEGKALEFYSCKDENATVSKGVYIPYPAIDTDGGIDISEQCYKAVIYMAAGLTMLACGEADKATAMMEMAKGLLGIANE
ncbi:MAG: hypothetical protein II539_08070 [Muribaculaceae bacterium]|nr:hypothetical protein [Muribaculaceae bacterium]